MTHAAATLPYGSFSNLILGSSYLDSALGIYKRGYHFWRWYAGASIVVEGNIKNNLALIAFSGTVDTATKYLGGNEYYHTFARGVAIAYYAVQVVNHLCQTWEDIGKMKTAFYEKEPACVIDFVDPPKWMNYVIDPATGRWLLTSLYLTALKMQRIAITTFAVVKDIFLLPYFMWRVQDAYFMDNFFEEKACKGMALLHAKLLLEEIGRYQKLAETNMINITGLVNQILETSSVNIKIDEVTETAKKINKFLFLSPKEAKLLSHYQKGIFFVGLCISPLTRGIAMNYAIDFALTQFKGKPELPKHKVRPPPRIVNNARKDMVKWPILKNPPLENPPSEEISQITTLSELEKFGKNYLSSFNLDPFKKLLFK